MERVAIALVVLAVVALGWLLYRRAAARRRFPERIEPADTGLSPAAGFGAVLFTTPYCLPCQEWARELDPAGVPYALIDVSQRPELARKYGIAQVPLVLGVRLPGGEVVAAFDDSPRPQDVARMATLAAGAVATAAVAG